MRKRSRLLALTALLLVPAGAGLVAVWYDGTRSTEGKAMAKLEGTISIAGLPPHRGLIVNLCFFPVKAADAPAPHGGDPPAEAVTDSHEVANQVDLHTESSQTSYDLPFAVERPAGHYYLQVRAILFRTKTGKVFAQAEQFFFARRPLSLTEEPLGHVTLPVHWPQMPLEELGTYGVAEPRK
jgi:hypothetical protein